VPRSSIKNNTAFHLEDRILTLETLPVPVNTNVKGPTDFGINPSEISYPASRTACTAWLLFL